MPRKQGIGTGAGTAVGGGDPASISAGAIPTTIDPTTHTNGPTITRGLFAVGCACASGDTAIGAGDGCGSAGEGDAHVKQKGPPCV